MSTPEVRQVSAESSTWHPPLPAMSGVDHLVVETPGLRTHVATIGDGDPVMLLHGFPAHWWQWHEIAPAIAGAGHRVICPDLRGSGWTTAGDPRIGRESHHHDLLALLDALGIERAHVVAHDLGVISANQLAYSHPERVRSLVQLSVPPMFMPLSLKLLSGFRHMPALVSHRRGRSLAGLFDPRYIAHPLPTETLDAYLAPMSRAEIDGAVRRIFRGVALPVSLQLARGTFARQRLQPPTLAVFGRLDHPWDEALIRRLCGDLTRYADRYELAFVDDAAHFITDDAPSEVTALALAWFQRAG
ncbi:alpha/beta fold hydrolase [Cellulomonas fengjieae]|uniref:Alpha/beta fold hydrolase n=1 Tax=Cellulomonas fengjieae TaxID=2819978 RepID=A0ABS3SLL7_9CELL|nr:alpha/beta fold hydrolase [Cellulomonas fengjieae]MBO3086622.1 alpha/beta fold hydrolase [Cellulomonas fengjieae]QVI66529.1 alpha/beta fold hydrolase [Cellulomonas fengjieae]